MSDDRLLVDPDPLAVVTLRLVTKGVNAGLENAAKLIEKLILDCPDLPREQYATLIRTLKSDD